MNLHELAPAALVASGGSREALGVGVAVLSAVIYDVGYVLEKQALDTLPPLRSHPVHLAATVMRSPRWVVGFGTMLIGLGLQVLALTVAPVSVVQPILACGLIGLAAAGSRVLGESLGARQLAALALVFAAVVAIALSTRTSVGVADRAPWDRFVALAAPATAVGLGLAVWAKRARSGSLLASSIGAGVLYGVGAVAEKAVATELSAHGLVSGLGVALGTAYPWLFVVATACGLMVFQIGLQQHPASMMATFTNVASSVCVLVGAGVVFGEALVPPSGWAAARIAGFAAVLAAGVVLVSDRSPAPSPAPTTP